MNRIQFIILILFLLQIQTLFADKNTLPNEIIVYSNDKIVTNNPLSALPKRVLKIVNHYKGDNACYIAAYSHNKKGSAYSVGGDIYVMGLIRLKGEYVGRICHPKGYLNKDISAEKKFKQLASQYFKACIGKCWAGGDTGGFFDHH